MANNKASNTARGNEFRDAIYDLICTRFHVVNREVKTGGTTADILYEEERYGRTIRVAVETKAWANALGPSDVTSIVNMYQPALQSGDLDELIIVSNEAPTKQAHDVLTGYRWVRILSAVQLEEIYFSIRKYVQGLARSTVIDESWYVRPKFAPQRKDALTYLKDWLAGIEGSPIAILGGYGRGKSTL